MLSYTPEQSYEYWNSYIDSYLMRDATDDNGITDETGFRKLLRACAAYDGQLINYSKLAEVAVISGVTAQALFLRHGVVCLPVIMDIYRHSASGSSCRSFL